MAYKVAQLRKDPNKSYGTPMVYTLDTTSTSNPYKQIYDKDSFTDLVIVSTQNSSGSSSAPSNVGFRSGQTYFLSFQVRCIPEFFYSENDQQYQAADILKLTLFLKHSTSTTQQPQQSQSSGGESGEGSGTNTGDETDDDAQQIGTCTVLKTSEDNSTFTNPQYMNFSFVFTPKEDFDNLVFKVQRNRYDVLNQNQRNWLILDILNTNDITQKERLVAGTIFTCNTLTILNNLVPDSIIGQSSKEWLKFGFQGRPGSLIVVNGQPIRVGRSGIYELNNGLKITKFMIAGSTIDAFLLDYAYETSST